MKNSITLTVLISGLAYSAFAGPVEVKKGEALFKAKCIACHNPAQDAMAPKAVDIAKVYAKKDAKNAASLIEKFISKPTPAAAIVPKAMPTKKWGQMPAIPVSPTEAKVIGEYIASLAATK